MILPPEPRQPNPARGVMMGLAALAALVAAMLVLAYLGGLVLGLAAWLFEAGWNVAQ